MVKAPNVHSEVKTFTRCGPQIWPKAFQQLIQKQKQDLLYDSIPRA